MKSLILTVLGGFILTTSTAQHIKMQDNTALVDNQAYLIIKKKGCKTVGGDCAYEVHTLDNRKIALATVKKQDKKDKADLQRSPNQYYVEYRFFEPDELRCETPFPMSVTLHPTDVVKQIFTAGIVTDGYDIDEEALLDFVDTYGSTFSEADGSSVEAAKGIEDRLKQKRKSKKAEPEDEEPLDEPEEEDD